MLNNIIQLEEQFNSPTLESFTWLVLAQSYETHNAVFIVRLNFVLCDAAVAVKGLINILGAIRELCIHSRHQSKNCTS